MILNGRELIEVLPLRELYSVYQEHERLTVFVNKGRSCVICNRVGTLLLVTVGKNGDRHVDLYTDDFVLMTVDHTVPKSQAKEMGWTKQEIECLSNKQPMCEPCNHSKGHKLVSNEQHRLNRLRNGYPQRIKGVEVIRELVYNEGIFNRSLA